MKTSTKLHKVLQVKHGVEAPSARSTMGEILRRHGLKGTLLAFRG